jgi:hypothetical protein
VIADAEARMAVALAAVVAVSYAQLQVLLGFIFLNTDFTA